jgi:hypothetical protein
VSQIEEWRPVVGFENSYEVSSFGRVRSLDRSWPQLSRHGTTYTYSMRGRVLRPGPNGIGVALAEQFGVSDSVISHIKNERLHIDVDINHAL